MHPLLENGMKFPDPEVPTDLCTCEDPPGFFPKTPAPCGNPLFRNCDIPVIPA